MVASEATRGQHDAAARLVADLKRGVSAHEVASFGSGSVGWSVG